MSTISPVNLRPPIQSHCNLYLSILRPATLLAAAINGTFDRGARSLDYGTGGGSGYATIAAGQTVEIDTAYGTKIVRLKSKSGAQAAGTLGIAENGIITANTQDIRVLHNYEIYPVFPAIRSGVFYKDYDIVYSNQNSTPNPVAISQSHLAGFLSSGSIVFTISLASSYAIASGATIASYSHSCVHNGGGSTGITIASATAATTTLTITEADTYWLSQTVTDSNGKTQTINSVVFVHSTDSMPYVDFTLQQLSGDWDSGHWRCSLNLTGDLTLADVPDGSLAVVWYQNYFDGVEGYINLLPYGNNIVYAGYIWADNDQDNWQNGTGAAAFEIISPLTYLDAITDYGTVSLEATTSPASWAEYASWLTVGRGVHALLKWDTTYLDCWPVYGLTSNTYGVKVIEFTEDTLLQRINGVANDRGIHAKLVADRRGVTHLVVDSQMLNTAGRNALDTVFTIAATDISGGVNVVRNAETTRAFADLDGFTYSHPTSTPFISMIPGYIESTVSYNLPEPRGVGVDTKKSQVLNAAGGQTDSNERVGRLLALVNVDPREIRIACRGNYLGAFDIVPNLGWYGWGVADGALKRELPLSGIRTVCRSVTHSPIYENDLFTGFIQTTEVVLQPEAVGEDGIPGNYPLAYPAITTPDADWDAPEGEYAYFAGGGESGVYVVTADRLNTVSGITSAYSAANLSQARESMGVAGDGVLYAYFAGGEATGSNFVTTADRLNMITGVTAANAVSNLSVGRDGCNGVSDGGTYGYFGGGFSAGFVFYDDTDRITFSTGVTAANAGSNLSLARELAGPASDGATYGYWAGGRFDALGTDVTAVADRITFATSVTAANAGSNLSDARNAVGGISGTSYGYFLGGVDGSTYTALTDRVLFSTGVTAANAGSNLSDIRAYVAGLSDTGTYGYSGGGSDGVSLVAITDRVDFSTSVTAANAVSNLSAARATAGGANAI